ncbi:MAG: hypothetical protein K2Q34_08530 [Alphaproteobacteria bacterium]|nr:hypothetical protein [Alphaproteobacteria bacterium]
MIIMKLGYVIIFFCMFSQLCRASTTLIVVPDHEDKPVTSPLTPVKPGIISHTDESLSDSDSAEEAAPSPRYNAAEIISEIQESSKKSYLKGRLFIDASLFKKIKEGDEGIIAKFKEEIAKLTLSPEGVTDAWSYTIEYYPTLDKIIANISDHA